MIVPDYVQIGEKRASCPVGFPCRSQLWRWRTKETRSRREERWKGERSLGEQQSMGKETYNLEWYVNGM